jgi:hypothetical protein
LAKTGVAAGLSDSCLLKKILVVILRDSNKKLRQKYHTMANRVLIVSGLPEKLSAYVPGETQPICAEIRALPHPRYPGETHSGFGAAM